MRKLNSIICWFFGHQPHDYHWEDDYTWTEYTECDRCSARKITDERGWDHQ